MRVAKVFGLAVSAAILAGCAATSDVPPLPAARLGFELRCAEPAVVKCVGSTQRQRSMLSSIRSTEQRRNEVTSCRTRRHPEPVLSALRFHPRPPRIRRAATGKTFPMICRCSSARARSSSCSGASDSRPSFSERATEMEGDGNRRSSARETAPGATVYSCTQLEIVTQNTYQRGFPQMYHSCGGKDGQYQALANVRAVSYRPNQWMTFQIQVKVGHWYRNDRRYRRDSTVRLWVAEEGRSSRLAVDDDQLRSCEQQSYRPLWRTMAVALSQWQEPCSAAPHRLHVV